jgi:hypothetical protein
MLDNPILPSTKIPMGRSINRDQADKTLEKYIKNTKLLMKAVKLYEERAGRTALRNFVKPDVTAYIFHKDEVMRFFQEDSKAEYLFVVMGAQPEDENSADPNATDFVKNEPTVILMGCLSDGKKFDSIDIKNPYQEHPTYRLLTKMPAVGDGFSFEVER